jgi:uncharacterized integral membrane protein
MDRLDHLTVIVYRMGLTLAAPIIALLPWTQNNSIQPLVFVAAAMCASSLHIYMKSFRLLLQMATWVGLLCVLFGWPMIGMGGAFITLGGLCVKEYFCFKIPGLQLQPFLLASLWACLVFEWTIAAQILALICAGLFLVVGIAKWRMPRHFDIGDKTRYEC